jgi:hypothetical protein
MSQVYNDGQTYRLEGRTYVVVASAYYVIPFSHESRFLTRFPLELYLTSSNFALSRKVERDSILLSRGSSSILVKSVHSPFSPTPSTS